MVGSNSQSLKTGDFHNINSISIHDSLTNIISNAETFLQDSLQVGRDVVDRFKYLITYWRVTRRNRLSYTNI